MLKNKTKNKKTKRHKKTQKDKIHKNTKYTKIQKIRSKYLGGAALTEPEPSNSKPLKFKKGQTKAVFPFPGNNGRVVKTTTQNQMITHKFSIEEFNAQHAFTHALFKMFPEYIADSFDLTENNQAKLKNILPKIKLNQDGEEITSPAHTQIKGTILSQINHDTNPKKFTDLLKFIIEYTNAFLADENNMWVYLDPKPANFAEIEGEIKIIDCDPQLFYKIKNIPQSEYYRHDSLLLAVIMFSLYSGLPHEGEKYPNFASCRKLTSTELELLETNGITRESAIESFEPPGFPESYKRLHQFYDSYARKWLLENGFEVLSKKTVFNPNYMLRYYGCPQVTVPVMDRTVESFVETLDAIGLKSIQ